jgi:hypothetical protein
MLPMGTITMLFSDIEGSTRLLGRPGDQYGEALSARLHMATPTRACGPACCGCAAACFPRPVTCAGRRPSSRKAHKSPKRPD